MLKNKENNGTGEIGLETPTPALFYFALLFCVYIIRW